jgi:hypothetical protein
MKVLLQGLRNLLLCSVSLNSILCSTSKIQTRNSIQSNYIFFTFGPAPMCELNSWHNKSASHPVHRGVLLVWLANTIEVGTLHLFLPHYGVLWPSPPRTLHYFFVQFLGLGLQENHQCGHPCADQNWIISSVARALHSKSVPLMQTYASKPVECIWKDHLLSSFSVVVEACLSKELGL